MFAAESLDDGQTGNVALDQRLQKIRTATSQSEKLHSANAHQTSPASPSRFFVSAIKASSSASVGAT